MKANLCENCNSQVVTIRKGSKIVAECSYCGYSPDIDDFVPELDEDNE